MKKIVLALSFLSLISCASSNLGNKENLIKTNFTDLKIATSSLVKNATTITCNELRFYNIDSAFDTKKSMFLDFGISNEQTNGMHQNNIRKMQWTNVKLFDSDDRFTIIADGTETTQNYFACLIVFDNQGKDCLNENHPLKNEIVNYFQNRMKKNRDKKVEFHNIK